MFTSCFFRKCTGLFTRLNEKLEFSSFLVTKIRFRCLIKVIFCIYAISMKQPGKINEEFLHKSLLVPISYTR
uniref:Uncharacterized protein n=1 Tax=Octopus bimaculoides TaxID=37653 RepID=A0A0L8G3Y7_OCTBM